MARQQYYPGADRNAQNFYAQYPALFAPSRRMADVNTLVLHTTEGGSWPGYSNGTMTPTFTYDPRSHQMRQHIPVDMAARALVDAGIGTNRLNVGQVEIIGYAAQGGPLDAQAVQDLGALVAWLHAEWSLPITAPYPFAVPAHRMSAAEYIACRGVIGHEHVYGNTHWDPGAMNVPAILAAASRTAGPGGIAAGTVHIPGAPTFPTDTPVPPTQEDDDMAVTFNLSDGTRDVAVVGRIGDVIGVFASVEELQCWQAATAPNPGVINTRQLDLYEAWRNRSTQTTAIQEQIATLGTPTVSGADVAAAVVSSIATKLGA